jgi:predicted deacylase
MSASQSGARQYDRVVGRVKGRGGGATLIAVGGIHGNEPAGVEAMRRVLRRLVEGRTPIHGEILAFAGNVPALNKGRRYLDTDMNRLWAPEALAEQSAKKRNAEHSERDDLRAVLDGAIDRARGDVYALDLHSTSAIGGPFAIVRSTLASVAFAAHLPIPVLVGLSELLEGVLTNYLDARGCRAVAVEGGQHDDPKTTDRLEAAVWVALAAAGILDAEHDDVREAVHALDVARGGLPRQIQVTARHAVTPRDKFRMEPGFANIAPVRKGELLAHTAKGPIRAATSGYVMLPLYQSLGSDGFFLGKAAPQSEKQRG